MTRAAPGWRRLAALLVLCAATTTAGPSARAVPEETSHLTGVRALRRAYDAALNASFEEAAAHLDDACGPAPPEACLVLDATRLWWRILLDPYDTSRDAEFLARVEEAIAACERWTEREPGRAEAWFYLGGAYGARVSWRVQRGQRLAAARDGKRIKEALEEALTIAPGMADARFGIGLYKYYADVAPAFARFLRVLLLLPGGDRAAGLADMEAAREDGLLVTGEADYQLHWIYLWYEDAPEAAMAALERLHARYPRNPHFLQRIAEVRQEYFHDPAGSLAAWQTLVNRASQMGTPGIARTRGELGVAAQLDRLFETDRAVELLERVIARAPRKPAEALALAHVQLGEALARLGDADRARAEFRAALDAVPDDLDALEDRARDGLRRRPDPRTGHAYRIGLEGWRLYERGRVADAIERLSHAVEQAPELAMTRARLGRALAASGDDERALAELNAVIAGRATAPPVAVTAAYLWSGAVFEERGDRHAAAERYREATHVFGGDSRLVAEARRALARVSQ
ncbi:MAG TPA: tetratricopeptide repeat protein [Vicinamibacterales bacterium]